MQIDIEAAMQKQAELAKEQERQARVQMMALMAGNIAASMLQSAAGECDSMSGEEWDELVTDVSAVSLAVAERILLGADKMYALAEAIPEHVDDNPHKDGTKPTKVN